MKAVVRMKYGTKVSVSTANQTVGQTFWDAGHFQRAQDFLKDFAARADEPVTTHVFEAVSQPE